MKRRGFISATLLAPLVLAAKPVEAEPVEHEDRLWPNTKAYPCRALDCAAPEWMHDCDDCRKEHNELIIESDPEWYDNIYVSFVDGRWHESDYDEDEDLCECCDELTCDCGMPDTTCPRCLSTFGTDHCNIGGL